ncbi:hypothetical protein Ga0080559_TMP3913 [Salipiger profundus]|uniref:Uncharacterized protein n=1 Tax=Salipiger profundus TaxID=1229727 RepID=A0A1U7D998_9RHOB|nr:hypothetical protein Ga0080559_TMP3913 [Salipiger profundus]
MLSSPLAGSSAMPCPDPVLIPRPSRAPRKARKPRETRARPAFPPAL